MAPARSRLQLPPVVAVPIIIACLALIIEQISHVIPLAVAGQAYLLIILLLGFRYWPPMGRWMGRMPAVHRAAFGVLVGAMILGHFTLSSRKYFPYVAWAIFPRVREDNPVSCREFLATTASGKSVRLLVEQLFPSIVQFNPPVDNDSTAMTDLVRTLVNAYDARHASDPVQRLDLVLVAVKLHPSADESHSPPSCQLLKSYVFSSGRSN